MDVTRKILTIAADYIEANGWAQGKNRDKKGQVCARFAIMNTSFSARECLKAVSHLIGFVRYKGILVDTVESWNDIHAGNQENVIQTLRASAEWSLSDEN